MKDIVPCELPPPPYCYLCLKLSAETFLRLIEGGGGSTVHTMDRSEEIRGVVDFLKLFPLFSDNPPAQVEPGYCSFLSPHPGEPLRWPCWLEQGWAFCLVSRQQPWGEEGLKGPYFICLLQSRQRVTRQPRCIETFFVFAQLWEVNKVLYPVFSNRVWCTVWQPQRCF